jgi:hypothetical protein
MLHFLRLTSVALVIFVAVCSFLWVRSYRYSDTFDGSLSATQALVLNSDSGRLTFSTFPADVFWGIYWRRTDFTEKNIVSPLSYRINREHFWTDETGSRIELPHASLIATGIIVAAFAGGRRFSLRSFLICVGILAASLSLPPIFG